MTHAPRTILITGASSGLGEALALAYAEAGVTLFLTGRNAQRLEATAILCKRKGAEVETAVIDVQDREKLQQWIEIIDDRSPIDLVIANAGISAGTAGGAESAEQTRAIFAINLDGVLNTLLPLIPRMQARHTGQIALISSLAGFRGLPSSPAYSGSKAAVKVYGEALRGLLAKENIRVTVITPGYIKTPMTDVNEFPMPFLVPVHKAAARIKKRLRANPARIAFPLPLHFFVWLLSCLSPTLTDPLFARLPGKKGM